MFKFVIFYVFWCKISWYDPFITIFRVPDRRFEWFCVLIVWSYTFLVVFNVYFYEMLLYIEYILWMSVFYLFELYFDVYFMKCYYLSGSRTKLHMDFILFWTFLMYFWKFISLFIGYEVHKFHIQFHTKNSIMFQSLMKKYELVHTLHTFWDFSLSNLVKFY